MGAATSERIQHEARFRNARSSVAIARRLVACFASEQGMYGEELSDLVTAAGEALSNAVEHGYRPHTSIFVRLAARRERLIVEVEDQGSGFAAGTFSYAQRLSSRGNGLTIMHKLVDRLSYKKNGRLIRLEKRFHPQFV